ncbi:FYN-binding protein 1-like isoform X2 [Cetorhinus maximus]
MTRPDAQSTAELLCNFSVKDGKSDVKALMARFGNKPVEETSAIGPRPVKFTPHSSLQGNMSSVASKAAGFESSSAPKFPALRSTGSFSEKASHSASNLISGKPAFPKPSAVKAQFEGLQKETNDSKPPFIKPSLGSKSSLNTFTALKDERDERAHFTKPHFGLKPTVDPVGSHKENEVRSGFLKPSQFSKPLNPVTSHEAKPAFPKSQFPKPTNSGNVSEDKPLKPVFSKPPTGLKPWNESSSSPKENTEDIGKEDSGIGRGTGPFTLKAFKPVNERGRFPSQTSEDKVATPNEGGIRPSGLKSFPPKPKQEEATPSHSGPSKIQKLQNQFLIKAQSQELEEGDKDPNVPKRRPLPAPWTLGAPPQKPNRPPTVNLDLFRQPQWMESPTLPVSNRPANKMPPPPSPMAPNLPPRPLTSRPPDIIPTTEEDENYDDVQSVGPPPLPPMKPEDRWIPAASNNPEEKDESDGEMYEDLDNYRSLKELKEQERRKEKEDKRRQEQERKEQKEKKRELEMRKKFKLSGAIEVIQNVKVTMDYKGGKNELSCKQGEWLEVIRITDNPEGKWLARALDGSYGYIKVTCVDINYDEIKKKTGIRPKESMPIMKQPVQDQELYDDVAPNDDTGPGSNTGGSGVFPSPPSGEEIYDDVDGIPEDIVPSPASQDASKFGSWSWGLLKKKKAEKDDKDKKAKEKESSEVQGESGERQLLSSAPPAELADGEDVYDDVGAEEFPPLPPEFSLLKSSKAPIPGKGKKDEKDYKKTKKMEKEEKDFRKKFKYDGEIRVLGTVEVIQNLPARKWANRELPVKAGEVLDIIQHTDDIKLLCRNEDGKYGYVQKANLALGNDGDSEIYDDIDAECIYDND